MSASLVGKVLCCDFEQSGWVGCSRFCLVLEEKENTLLAVGLASESQDWGSHAMQWPSQIPSADDLTQLRYRPGNDPFLMRKGAKAGCGVDSTTVAYVAEGPNEGNDVLWDGYANKAYFIGY